MLHRVKGCSCLSPWECVSPSWGTGRSEELWGTWRVLQQLDSIAFFPFPPIFLFFKNLFFFLKILFTFLTFFFLNPFFFFLPPFSSSFFFFHFPFSFSSPPPFFFYCSHLFLPTSPFFSLSSLFPLFVSLPLGKQAQHILPLPTFLAQL